MIGDFTSNLQEGPWATFCLADEVFAVNANFIQEVLVEQPLTPVPLAPKYVAGLLNLRGQVMSAIDLRTRLNFPRRASNAQASLIVINLAGNVFSLVVDSIGDVGELDQSAWEAPPQTLSPEYRRFVFGINVASNKIILGLDLENIEANDETPQKVGKAS